MTTAYDYAKTNPSVATCPECGQPVQVWADRSGGVTVNFECLNVRCTSGKPPWDTPRPERAS